MINSKSKELMTYREKESKLKEYEALQVLLVFKDHSWLYKREIINELSEMPRSKVYCRIRYLREKEYLRTRAKKNEDGQYKTGSYQYAISDKGIHFLNNGHI